MTQITRKLLKIFGSDAGGTGITEYGSPASGAPVYSTDVDDIQTASWDGGWADAALAGTEIPTFQDFNAIHYTTTTAIKYLNQAGIPEYLATETYYISGVVRKLGTYELYGSLVDDNIGNALPSQVDDSNWEYLGDLLDLGGGSFGSQLLHVQDQKATGVAGGNNSLGLNKRDLNTVLTNEIVGSSLSSNEITLTAGTYYMSASAPAKDINRHRVSLYNETDAAFILAGTSEDNDSNGGGGSNLVTRSFVEGRFTLAGTKSVSLQHYFSASSVNNSLGGAVSDGEVEVYSDLKIWKVA